MAVRMEAGSLPHIYWIDLKNDGVYVEAAVMKRDNFGNVYYIALNALDRIDKGRLARIVKGRNAPNFELWDLMSNITLNNGVNALTYFHQLVQVITPGGKIMKPQEGTIGVDMGVIDTRGAESRQRMEDAANAAARAAATAAGEAAAAAFRNAQAPAAPAQAPQAEAAPAPTARKTTRKKAAPASE